MNKFAVRFLILFLFFAVKPEAAFPFTEPSMIDYHNEPIFQTASQIPNVLLLFDNSANMNLNAYGEDPVTMESQHLLYPVAFWAAGEVKGDYACDQPLGYRYRRVAVSRDDADEKEGVVDTQHEILKLGWDDTPEAGVRFRDVYVPKNARIQEARIIFTAFAETGGGGGGWGGGDNGGGDEGAARYNIYAEYVDDAQTFDNETNSGISLRRIDYPSPSSPQQWNIPGGDPGKWEMGEEYQTCDLKDIVQDIVDRDGWRRGNAMVFIIQWLDAPGGKRRAVSYDYEHAMADGKHYAPQLYIKFNPDDDDHECTKYYGYFNNEKRYRYYDGAFEIDDNGDWDGNWLNWAVMKRVDIAKKVLMGGEVLSPGRDDSGEQILVGAPSFTSTYLGLFNAPVGAFVKNFDGTGFTKFPGNEWYLVQNRKLTRVDWKWGATTGGAPLIREEWRPASGDDVFNIRVRKKDSEEPEEFVEGNLAGVLQRIGGAKARWGNMWFHEEPATGWLGSSDPPEVEGGYISNPIGTSLDTIIEDINDKTFNAFAPLGEALYVAMQYFKQEAPGGVFTPASDHFQINDTWDPFTHDEQLLECTKSFVVTITAGKTAMDQDVPSDIRDYAKDQGYRGDREWALTPFGRGWITTDLKESDYFADVALYARTNDLRSDLEGDQHMMLYVLNMLFDQDPGSQTNMGRARRLFLEAARNGGFDDINDTGLPDSVGTYCKECTPSGENYDTVPQIDKACTPDNYFWVKHGYEIEDALQIAISDLLKRAASGTAVSVLATRGEGEGVLAQAFFKPSVPVGSEEVAWTGYVQTLWVDHYGNLREDTNQNMQLDLAEDKIVRYYLDPGSGDTRVKLYDVSAENMYPGEDDSYSVVSIESIFPLWEAGDVLADRNPDDRTVYTSMNGSSFTPFTTLYSSDFQYYFGIEDNDRWRYLGETIENRRDNLVHYIRGVGETSAVYQGDPNLRSRTMDDGRLWKLGDIVYSTPVIVSVPVEKYGVLYDAPGYNNFWNTYKDRETVVYVGANDGMIHAFTGGEYDTGLKKFNSPSGGYEFGDELWAYIPRTLLPHLKWLPSPNYIRVSYVDLKPKVLDAPIFEESDKYPGGWGTILVGGLNFGGRQIKTQGDGTGEWTFNPSFFAIDVTDPRDPSLMWEKTYPGLGLTTNEPAVLKVGDSWFLAIGSGPTDFRSMGNEVLSTQNAKILIVDLETGELMETFESVDSNSYFNTPVSLDKWMNYNVDALYAGTTYDNGTSYKGRMYKVVVQVEGEETDPVYDDDPENWSMMRLFESPAPFAAPFTLSVGHNDNTWVFAGTGKFNEQIDKTTTQQNYIFAVKDPFYNRESSDNNTFSDCYKNHEVSGDECEVKFINLFDAEPYTVKADGSVEGGGDINTFRDLVFEARKANYHGWYRELCSGEISTSGICQSSGSSERVLSKSAIAGGILLTPTFSPIYDPCGGGGTGRLFVLFYETGTAYSKRIVGPVGQQTIQDVIYLGEGFSTSLGVHFGRQAGGKGYAQMSTGVIVEIDFAPAFSTRSGPLFWRDFR